jgi:hypothetical protein
MAPLFLWIVLVPCAGDQPSDRGGNLRVYYDRVSQRDRLGLTPDLTTRWATENNNFVYSSLWDFKSYFTCRKTFPLYFPSERKVCCGFLSPLKMYPLGRVLNPQTLGPVASTLTTSPPRRLFYKNNDSSPCHAPHSSKSLSRLHVSVALIAVCICTYIFFQCWSILFILNVILIVF